MLAPVVVVRVAILAIGAIAGHIRGDAPTGLPDWLRVWYWWDTPHYLHIAQQGYVATANTAISAWAAFFPLYPALIRVGSLLVPPLPAAMLISFVATLAAAFGLYRLVLRDGDDRPMARRAVLALNLFPTSFALVAPYSESLFLALSIWALLAARLDRWATAGILGLLAGLARVQGWLLGPVLLVEHYLRRGLRPRMLWAFAVGLAPLILMGIDQVAYGDPLFFLKVQADHFYHHFEPPWSVIGALVRGVANQSGGPNWPMIYLAPLASIILLALVAGWLSRRRQVTYAAYAWLALILVASTSWPISAPRYVGAVFPLFIALADVGRWRWLWLPGAVISTALLVGFTVLFVRGGWAF